jgi:hypothetical protein
MKIDFATSDKFEEEPLNDESGKMDSQTKTAIA